MRRFILIVLSLALFLGVTPPAQAAGRVVVGSSGDVAAIANRVGPISTHKFNRLSDRPTASSVAAMTGIQYTVPYTTVANARAGSTTYNQIVAWARAVKAHRGTVFLALHHEPDCISQNIGQGTPYAYIVAWRNVHNIFAQQGVTNVKWTWNMMAISFVWTTGHPERWYPGSSLVDVVAVDGYNWGAYHPAGPASRSGAEIFGKAYYWAYYAGKRFMVGEFGSHPTNRPAWLRAFADWLSTMKYLDGVFAFNNLHAVDWRLKSSADYAAFGYLRTRLLAMR